MNDHLFYSNHNIFVGNHFLYR